VYVNCNVQRSRSSVTSLLVNSRICK